MALAILQKDRAFDLLFTDIRMPSEMDGWELAAEAKRLIPDLQVVFATGFNDGGGRLCEGDRTVSNLTARKLC